MIINPIAMPFDQTSSTSQTGSSSSTDNNSPTPDSLANSSSDLFLQLLVAQLKTQDPTSPMDPTQMVGQMLSMNQLNELIQIRQLMQGGDSTTPSQPTTTPTGA
jgi:flagellar hook assembly protein FlgD